MKPVAQRFALAFAALLAAVVALTVAYRSRPTAMQAHGGSGTGAAQDATGQAILMKLGVPTPCGGSGTGQLQDSTMQCLYNALPEGGAQANLGVGLQSQVLTTSAADAAVWAAAPTFVFQPGGCGDGGAQAPNVFCTWPPLYAALPPVGTSGTRPPSVILVDDSYSSPATIPEQLGSDGGSLAYNFDGISFQGVANYNTNAGQAALSIAAGTTATWTSISFNQVQVTFAGSTPLFAVSGASQEVNVYASTATLLTSSTGALVSSQGASDFVWARLIDTQVGDGTHPVFNATTSGTLEVTCLSAGCHFFAGSVETADSGTGTLSVIVPVSGQGSGISLVVPNVALGIVEGNVGAPLAFAAGTPFSVAIDASLSSAQQAFPTYHLTGTVPSAGTTLVIPNIVGAPFFLDLSAVTLTGTLTLQAGTGATKANVTAANLSATGQSGVLVQVTASNVVTRY